MSKVYEALQKRERESGKLPPGVTTAAREVFEKGTFEPSQENSAESGAGLTEDSQPLAFVEAPAKPAFVLDAPVEKAVITAESRIVYHSDPGGAGADRFRLLRMRLRNVWETGKLKSLLITSAQARDGKSTMVLNLATALSENGQKKVLVIEGDLHHPSLGPRCGLEVGEGLAECLEAGKDPLSLVRRIEPLQWYFLSAGNAQGNPTELLQSPGLRGIFEKVLPYFDWVIVDSPPIVPLSDTVSLRQHVDAVMLVVRAATTPRTAVKAAVGRVGTQHLLGMILNDVEGLDRMYSDYRKAYGARKKG